MFRKRALCIRDGYTGMCQSDSCKPNFYIFLFSWHVATEVLNTVNQLCTTFSMLQKKNVIIIHWIQLNYFDWPVVWFTVAVFEFTEKRYIEKKIINVSIIKRLHDVKNILVLCEIKKINTIKRFVISF